MSKSPATNTKPILIVREPFGDRQRGEIIRDAADMQAVYDADQDGFCNRAEEAVEPEAPAAPRSAKTTP